jgi:hypothetical protein
LLEETLWRAEVLAALADSSQFRVARPVPALDEKWVVQGWEACQFVSGETDVRRPGPGRPRGSKNHHRAPHPDVGKTIKRNLTITERQSRNG